MDSFRERLEEKLLTLPNVRALDESAAESIGRAKDGNFGRSYLGFLLYCHGRNPRGMSRNIPNGLLYADNDTMFGIGIFRRQGETRGGHLMVVAPDGPNPVEAVQSFIEQVNAAAPHAVSRCFVRFLDYENYRDFLEWDFLPITEDPWHPHAPAEDETFCHSDVDLTSAFEGASNENGRVVPRRRRLRDDCHRFQNFLDRHGIDMRQMPFDSKDAKTIVKNHFNMTQRLGRNVGSVAQDYESLLEADLSHPDRFGFMLAAVRQGRTLPVSVFAGEKTSHNKMALYCSITHRDASAWSRNLGLPTQLTGFSALGTYAYWQAFCEIKKRFPEVTHVQLGGSETADLDAFKRRMGAKMEPTYWAVKRF